MSIVDIIALIIIALSGIIGFKRGAIKSFIYGIGLLAIAIIAYQFKDILANVLIRNLPFFNYSGELFKVNLNELYSLNFLVYEGISFLVLFVILDCVLNILINLSNLIESIIKWIPLVNIASKIGGLIFGLFEGIIYVFIIAFTLLTFGQSQKLVMESKVTRGIVERTPIVNSVFRQGIGAVENVYEAIQDYQDNKDVLSTNVEIVRDLVKYQVITDDLYNECNAKGKLHMENVVIAS